MHPGTYPANNWGTASSEISYDARPSLRTCLMDNIARKRKADDLEEDEDHHETSRKQQVTNADVTIKETTQDSTPSPVRTAFFFFPPRVALDLNDDLVIL